MKLGDRVQWKSQSGSFSTTKTGMIVAVVPANVSPNKLIPNGFACNSKDGFGMYRDHETYLVKVDGKGRKLYWPRVQWLQAVPNSGISMTGMGLIVQIADLERQRDALAEECKLWKAKYECLTDKIKNFSQGRTKE